MTEHNDTAERIVPSQELHRIATTAIVIRVDGRMLITRRALHKRQWPGKWTVPGGGLTTDDYTSRAPTHVGETNQWYDAIEESIRREVREEVGLEVWEPWPVCTLAFVRSDGIPVVVLSYAAELAGPDDVVLDEDATHFAWVTAEEAARYDLIDGIQHELVLAAQQWRIR